MASTYGSKQIPVQLRFIRALSRTISSISPNIAGYLAYQLFCTPMNRATATLDNSPRKIHVPHKGSSVAGYEWAGTGKTIMLVHGWESSAGRFKKLIEMLTTLNYRVVAMDAPAHGASTGRQTNPIDYSDALYSFMQQVGDVDAIIAHSFGSPSTMMLLDRHPDIQVEKVVLVGAPNRIADMFAMFAKLIDLSDKAFEAMLHHAEKTVGKPAEDLNTASIAAARTEQALIVHDIDDNIVTVDNGRVIANAWHNSEYYETKKLGHRRILSHEGTLQHMIDWIAGA